MCLRRLKMDTLHGALTMARIRSLAILTHFSEISDPRIDRTKYHNLQDMIVVAICAAICGANGWADVERFGKAKID